jgi:hypothetical protein
MGGGEVPKKRREIRTQENRDPVILEIPRIDLSHRIPRRTRVRILERVGTRRIGVLEHVEILSHEIAIRDFATKAGPFIYWTRGRDPHHREIGNPGDK